MFGRDWVFLLANMSANSYSVEGGVNNRECLLKM